MKISVKHRDTKIVVKEGKNSETSIRWENQNRLISETISVIAEQVKKLNQ